MVSFCGFLFYGQVLAFFEDDAYLGLVERRPRPFPRYGPPRGVLENHRVLHGGPGALPGQGQAALQLQLAGGSRGSPPPAPGGASANCNGVVLHVVIWNRHCKVIFSNVMSNT